MDRILGRRRQPAGQPRRWTRPRRARHRASAGAANTAKGTPRHWEVQVSPIFGANGQVAQLLSISKDITEEWEAAQRERFLTEELEHRVKNTFAMVLAIAKQTFRGDANTSALQVYTTASWPCQGPRHREEVELEQHAHRRCARSALAPHRNGEGKFTVSGPEVTVDPRQALSLTLAVNELATNASSTARSPRPRAVSISLVHLGGGTPTFVFLWREHGGPPVAEPDRKDLAVASSRISGKRFWRHRCCFEPKAWCAADVATGNLPA